MRERIVDFSFSALEVLAPIFWITALLLLLIVLPLGLKKRTRALSLNLLMLASYVFGATAWLGGLAATWGLLGWFWILVGFFFFGVGVVPIGIIAALLEGYTGFAMGILFPAVMAFGSRFVAFHLDEKSRNGDRPF